MFANDFAVVAQREVKAPLLVSGDGFLFANADDTLVVRVQHQDATFTHAFGYERFDQDHVIDRFNTILAQVIFANVRDHTDIRPVITKSAANNSSASSFKHGHFNGRV